VVSVRVGDKVSVVLLQIVRIKKANLKICKIQA
jgi:hypothetical protein